MDAETVTAVEIRIRRSRLVGNHRYLGWTYDYITPVDITHPHRDGGSHPGPRAGHWAPSNCGSIDTLRRWLRGQFPDAVLVEEWKKAPR
jgi:hypothetical protein